MKYNPFNPNSIVSTNLFAGRTKYILKIINKLEYVKKGMPSSFFIFGERGIGKTALAKLLKYISENKLQKLGELNFLSSYYIVEKNQSIGSVLQASLNELTEKMTSSVIEKLGNKLGKLFKNGKFSIGAFSVEMGKANNEKQVILRDQIVSILTNIISSIRSEEKEEDKKDGVLIIIDEMSNIKDIEICGQLLRGITDMLNVNENGNISFLLIGYEDTVNNFYRGDISSRRYVDAIQLETMPFNEVKEVFEKGFKEAEIEWNSKELDKYLVATGGYPHSIQLLGHNLLEIVLDNNIKKKDWDKAISNTAKELQKKDFAVFYKFNGKSTTNEKILNILALSPKPLNAKEISELGKIKNVYQYLNELQKKGSIKINTDAKSYYLISQLFRTSILIHLMPELNKKSEVQELFNKIIKNLRQKTEGKG